MGTYFSQQHREKKKKVVVVGGAFAGQIIIRKLLEQDPQGTRFEIVLIDKDDFFEFICTNMVTLVDQDHFRRITIPFTRLRESFRSPNVYFKQGRLVKVNEQRQELDILVAKPKANEAEGFSGQQQAPQIEKIDYDFLVIGVGSNYSFPIKEPFDASLTQEQRNQRLEDERKLVENAKSVLVVGGGCNGVETIGYLADRIGNEGKKFGLCNRGPRLLPHFPVAASQAAEDSLRRMGVNIYLNTEYSEKTKKDLKYDHVIDCAGFRFKAPKEFLRGEMADCLDSKTGQIYVNQYMQVTNVNPTSKGDTSRPSHIKTFPNVFALGDVCLTIADEEKSVLPINFMAKELAHNIRVLSESGDKPDEPLRAIPDTIHRIYFVPFGFNDGIGVWNEFVVRGKIGPWMKDFITSIWMATTHNSKVAVMSYDFMYWNMGIMFKIFDSRLTSWLPCSSRKNRREDVRAAIKQKVLKQA